MVPPDYRNRDILTGRLRKLYWVQKTIMTLQFGIRDKKCKLNSVNRYYYLESRSAKGVKHKLKHILTYTCTHRNIETNIFTNLWKMECAVSRRRKCTSVNMCKLSLCDNSIIYFFFFYPILKRVIDLCLLNARKNTYKINGSSSQKLMFSTAWTEMY